MQTPWKKPFVPLALSLLAFARLASAATTVVITSPAAGRTTPNEFAVVAYSHGPESVRVLQVYLDGVKKYESVWPARNRINTLVSTASGTAAGCAARRSVPSWNAALALRRPPQLQDRPGRPCCTAAASSTLSF